MNKTSPVISFINEQIFTTFLIQVSGPNIVALLLLKEMISHKKYLLDANDDNLLTPF